MSAKSIRKKTWQEKLTDSKGLPRTDKVTGKMTARRGTGTMVVSAPVVKDFPRFLAHKL